MEQFLTDFILSWPIILISILSFLYWHFTKTFNHWKDKGVPFEKPVLIFGNIKDRLLFRKSFHEFQLDMYNCFKGNTYAGLFEGRQPTLMLRDPELIKCVMVKDFDYFAARPTFFRSRKPGYRQNMLLNLKGNEWKHVRQILTPAFTSKKLRDFKLLVDQCGKQLEEFLDSKIKSENPSMELELKDLFGRFTLDAIATCAFGVESNAIKFPQTELIVFMQKIGDVSMYKQILSTFILIFVPIIARLISFSFFNLCVLAYLRNVVRKVTQMRKTQGVRRNDFLQLLMENQHEDNNTDIIIVKEIQVENGTKQKAFISEATVSAQVILFLIGGYDTSSTLLTFASYQLCLNVNIQDKLRKHINEILEKYNGQCSYEALQEMDYLDMVFYETLRMHPPMARVDRQCTATYTLPNTNIQIKIGENVHVPIMGLHYDEDYYPNPYKFDPERFTPEEKSKRSPYVFLPFGAGPKNCIGLKFALMSSKLAMVYLLRKYKLTKSTRTKFEYDKKSIFLKPKNGLYLNIEAL